MKINRFIISLLSFILLVIIGVFFIEDEEIQKEDIAGIQQETLLYEVTRVIDGDTIEVEKDDEIYKVRMIGIDTPETVHPKKPVEYFGIEASNKLKEMIENKKVDLQTDQTQDDVDRYGRLLRYVYLDGVDINLEMIKQGYAFEYTYRIPYEKQEIYKQAEEFAKNNELGLWKR